ncbi:hypothetical protein BACCAP_01763 [Pseudoflavonifractor capillosus ATCC 29799]|uniref:Uncharacterized protein n=1 Tax=Pseudoflavonifractor capillosus ATCC 29799 TaxID=411467 RepID=A6NU81_9FIRM|nr:hypothetical protein BACCAP_01763 [Pseudoflavonifractor capillosus ATCC 29799]
MAADHVLGAPSSEETRSWGPLFSFFSRNRSKQQNEMKEAP